MNLILFITLTINQCFQNINKTYIAGNIENMMIIFTIRGRTYIKERYFETMSN